MKTVLGLSLAVILILTSCGVSKEVVIEQNISSVITGQVEKSIFNRNNIDSAICAIKYSYFAPDKLVYRDSVNRKIGDFVVRITQFGGRPAFYSTLSHQFFQAQLDSFERINRVEIEDYDDGINQIWELEATIEIEDFRDDFVQLHLSAWSYTGGAHGNGATTSCLIDKTTSKVIKLEDLFLDIGAVTKIGEDYFRKLYELEPDVDLDDAGFWFENNMFQLNNNFSISEHSIVFLYNSYEIAPYSAGETAIEIPIEEIKNYLKIKI